MRKIFICYIICLPLFAQTDFTKLSWRFRGPVNYNLGGKEVIDIATDPNNTQKLWACTFEDGLLFNENLADESSQWQRSSLVNRRVYKIKFHPNKPSLLYAIGDFVNWKSSDGGKTWVEMTHIQGIPRIYDIWVSKIGTVLVATKNDIFVSYDEGKTWKQILTVADPLTIKQLWVQENERIYVLKDDNKGLYSDANYTTWKEISLEQMRREEMPYADLEEFHAYVVQSGEVYHGFTTDRRKIKLQSTYSIDGGATYQSYLKPNDVIETVFLGNDMVFATKTGIFIYKTNKLQERNKGQLQGEYRFFAESPLVGDNNLTAVSTKGAFLMNGLVNTSAYEVNSALERYNSLFLDAKNSFVAVELNKSNITSYTHLEGRKMIPITQNVSLFLTNNGKLGKWTGSTTGNPDKGTLSLIETSETPIIYVYYNATISTVFCLLRDGRLLTIQNPDATNTAQIIKKSYQFQLPITSFNEGMIEELTSDGSQVLLSDRGNNLFAIVNEGTDKKLKQINVSAIKDLKINHLEFSLKFQKLFLATEKGIFMGEDIMSESPKWTNISNEIGEQSCIFIQLRSLDGQLSVLTRYRGVYSTSIFNESNQIITHSPRYFNASAAQSYFLTSRLVPLVCNRSSIKVDFTTNILPNQNVKYLVEISDALGNFSASPNFLKGESTQSPVEVEFIKPQPQAGNYRYRVVAQGAVNVIGSATPTFEISDSKDFTQEKIKLELLCEKTSVELTPIQNMSNPPYLWQKDGTVIDSATNATYLTAQAGLYKRTSTINGCNVSSIFEVAKALNTRPFFKPNVGFSYAGNTCVVDSFKLFTDYDGSYKYVWYRDDLVLTDVTKSEIFIRDKSKYKVLVISQEGCNAISEVIQLKTCDNGTDSRAIILNPPAISVDRKSIYPNDKATLRLESCDNVSMQWLKDSKPLLGANQNSLEVKEAGNYALQISKFGCTTISRTLTISVEPILSVGEGISDFDIEVFPNPTEEKLFISIPVFINTPIELKMMDISGKLIESFSISTLNGGFIDLKSLQAGVYLLVLEAKDKRVVKKIIKRN